MAEIPKIPTAEVPMLGNAVSAAPNTAAGVAGACVDKVAGFVGPLAGPALGVALAYWGLKTVVGHPPKIIEKMVA